MLFQPAKVPLKFFSILFKNPSQRAVCGHYSRAGISGTDNSYLFLITVIQLKFFKLWKWFCKARIE